MTHIIKLIETITIPEREVYNNALEWLEKCMISGSYDTTLVYSNNEYKLEIEVWDFYYHDRLVECLKEYNENGGKK